MRIGCFEVTLLDPGRWRVVNTITSFVHVTYGTEDEIRSLLEKQSASWLKRYEERAACTKKTKRNLTAAPMQKNPHFVKKP